MKYTCFSLLILLLFFSCKQKIPVGVSFHAESIYRTGESGDNFCLTWAADGSQVTSLDDGNWLVDTTREYHNRLYRITDGPDNFVKADIPTYPLFLHRDSSSWFGYGMLSVNQTLYSVISKTPVEKFSGPFTGVKLLKSKDNGESWFRVNKNGEEQLIGPQDSDRKLSEEKEMFFFKEDPVKYGGKDAYPFSYFDFVQHGRDNGLAEDGFLYIYSPEGAKSNKLLLARVPSSELELRASWEFFVGYENNQPRWSKKLSDRGFVHEFPEKNKDGNYFGWYSWLPSVVWNPGLGLYIMVNGGTYAGYGMTDSEKDYFETWVHSKTGSLGFWYSDKPYGPWKEFFYTDYWTADHPDNLTYQPKLSPKWISDDGKEMILVWSDAMKDANGNFWGPNYRWNHMKIKIEMQ